MPQSRYTAQAIFPLFTCVKALAIRFISLFLTLAGISVCRFRIADLITPLVLDL